MNFFEETKPEKKGRLKELEMQNSASFAWSSIHTPIYEGQQVATCILNSLRSFYNSHTYTALADFDTHVRCICLNNNKQDCITLDLSTFSPITDAYVLFYTFDILQKYVHVWGGLLFEQLQEEMPLSYITSSRTCALSMRSVVDLERHENKCIDFLFPANVFFGNAPPEFLISDTDLITKLDWYMDVAAKAMNDKVVVRPPLHFSSAQAEVDCIGACLAIAYQILYRIPRDIMNSQFDGRILCNKFRRIMLDGELYLLKNRLFRMHEDDLLHVLQVNGYTTTTDECLPIHHQSFVAHYPNADVLLPKHWLLVPFEQLPASVNFELEKGGLCRMPVYWEAIYEWQAFHLQTQFQRHFLNARMYEKQEDLTRFAKHVIMFIMNDLPVQSAIARAKQRASVPLDVATMEAHGKFVQDIEDMWSVMPPCMQQLKNNNRFPRNQERLYLVPTMYNGGFSLDSINRFLGALNDKWPKSPMAESVKKRANPEALIKRDPGIHWCSNVIKHTKEQRADTIHCPFVSVAEGVIDADGCGKRCAAHLGLRYPVKAPHNVIKYKLKFLVPTSEETRQAIVKEEEKKEESSLSEEEEEQSEEAKKSKRRKYINIA